MTPTLHVSLLGEFRVLSGETPITTLDTPRLQSLLAYLLLHHHAPQPRSQLAYLLWPDSTDSQAHTNLRNMLHKLRQSISHAEDYLHIERQTLSWQPQAPWTLDVLDFEKALSQAEQPTSEKLARQSLDMAVKLYRGDLLPNCYDEWILPERDRLRQLFLKALERLIELQEQERNYAAAITSAQHLLRYDPLHEATYRQLMRLYAVSGDRAAAVRTYHTCATVLERELAVQPSKTTRTAYEQLLQTEGPGEGQQFAQPTLVSAAPFVGRQQEWACLQAAWRNIATGRPHVFFLAGEAGIGKTRLAEELLTWVERQGSATAIARCYAAEGELAYAPVVAWLRGDALYRSLSSLPPVWLTEIARLLPSLFVEHPDLPRPAPLTENWQRQQLFEALARAVLHSKRPLLLLLDDVQWCDRETLAWLHYLLRYDPRAPLLLIGTVRSEEMTPEHPLTSLLLSLRRDTLVTEVTLDPFNATETADLAAHLIGEDLDSTVVDALFQETEGNPLFVVETVRAGAVEKVKTGHLSLDGSSVRPGALLPPTVQAVIASRLAQLSSAAREVMSLAAVIGRAFTLDVLAKTSNIDEDTLVLGLDELWQRRVVREQGGNAYDFSHDKLREQAYISLSAARRRLLHRRAGDALASIYAHNNSALDSMSGQIAAHYEQAGATMPAIAYHIREAEVARRIYAHAEALQAYRRALTLLETEPLHEEQRNMFVQCYEGIGDISALTGEAETARTAYQHALALVPDRILQASLYRKIAKVWENQHYYQEALQACSEAEAALGAESSRSDPQWWQEWLELQDKRLDLYGLLDRMDEAMIILEQMRPIVERYGTPMQRAEFFISSALSASRMRRFVTTPELLAEAHAGLAAHEALGNVVKIGWSHLSLGNLYQMQDSLSEDQSRAALTEAASHLRAAIDFGKRTGDALLYMRSLSTQALIYRRHGLVADVRQSAMQALAMPITMDQPMYAALNKANLAWVAWREGNWKEAEEYGQAAIKQWQALPYAYYSQWTALFPLIDITLTQGRFTEAIEDAQQLLVQSQQPLPDALVAAVEAAIQAWHNHQPDDTRSNLQLSIALAKEKGYL